MLVNPHYAHSMSLNKRPDSPDPSKTWINHVGQASNWIPQALFGCLWGLISKMQILCHISTRMVPVKLTVLGGSSQVRRVRLVHQGVETSTYPIGAITAVYEPPSMFSLVLQRLQTVIISISRIVGSVGSWCLPHNFKVSVPFRSLLRVAIPCPQAAGVQCGLPQFQVGLCLISPIEL